MEFKAKQRKLRVTIGADVFEVRFPSMGEIKDYRASVKGKAEYDDAAGEALMEFVADLGLPKEAQDRLEADDFLEIVRLLISPKKD